MAGGLWVRSGLLSLSLISACNESEFATGSAVKPVEKAAPAQVADVVEVVNQPPVAKPLSLSAARPEAIHFNLSADDAEGDVLLFQVLQQPRHGTVVLLNRTTGAAVYEPAVDFRGVDDMIYVAKDPLASSQPAPVTFTIGAAPSGLDATHTIYKNERLEAQLEGRDDDQDGLIYAIVKAPIGAIEDFDSLTGAYTYVPQAGFSGRDRFTYTVADASGASKEFQVIIEVVNRPPIISSEPLEGFQLLQYNSVNIPVTLRDFSDSHPDFESAELGLARGLIESEVDANGKPVLIPGERARGGITNAASFGQWFNDTQGINQTIASNLRLERVGETDEFAFASDAFFPLDDVDGVAKGFGHQGRLHNFHFTLEFQGSFIYKGQESFRFRGDDDLWVFINNQLVIDLGGVHNVEEGEVSLDQVADQLGLQLGERYSFRLFFAERHTDASRFRVETTIAFQEPEPYIYPVVASDPDGDAVLVTIVTTPEGMIYDATRSELVWPARFMTPGTYPVTLLVDDGDGGRAEQNFNVVVATQVVP